MVDVSTRVEAVRDGAVVAILDTTAAPSIAGNRDAAIQTSMSLTCLFNRDVDWLQDFLRPVLTINGVDCPLGLFVPTSVTDRYDGMTHTQLIDAYDKTVLLEQTRIDSDKYFNTGANYMEKILLLLFDVDKNLAISVPTTATFSTQQYIWEPGTNYLSIINQLLDQINYRHIYYNAKGQAVLVPHDNPSADRIDRHISTFDVVKPLAAMTSTVDFFNVPNVLKVICQNPELAKPIVATAQNDSMLSKMSIQRRGRRIVEVEQVDSTPSATELKAYAERKLFEKTSVAETVSISTPLLYCPQIYDTVALASDDISGIFVETAYSINFAPGGLITHTLERRQQL